MPRFEIKTDSEGRYMFNLKNINGEVILISSVFETKTACLDGINTIRENSDNYILYKRNKLDNGTKSFQLTLPNGRVVGTSKIYERSVAMEMDISAVISVAQWARIEDCTKS